MLSIRKGSFLMVQQPIRARHFVVGTFPPENEFLEASVLARILNAARLLRSTAMEVYAVTREFQEWGKGLYNRLPTPIRNGLKAAGVCHYMVVVREGPEGDLYSFDFGPVGGDVTGALSGGSLAGFPQSQLCFDDVVPGSLPMRRSQSTPALFKEAPEEEDELDEPVEATVEILAAAKDPAAAAAGSSTAGGKSRRRRPLGRREKKWVVGEIREHKIDELPEGTHFLGTTEMTLDDIRDFNAGRSKMYALHDNDCRHYMNELCSRLVPDLQKLGRGGVASKVAWDATWGRLRSGRPEIHLLPIQAMADLRNQPALERIKTASMASVMFSLGMRALPIVFKPVLPLATAVGNAGPVRRLVTTAAGAVAGVSSEVPIVREALFAGNVAMESISGVAHGLVRGSVNLVHATSGLLFSSGQATGLAAASAGSLGAESAALGIATATGATEAIAAGVAAGRRGVRVRSAAVSAARVTRNVATKAVTGLKRFASAPIRPPAAKVTRRLSSSSSTSNLSSRRSSFSISGSEADLVSLAADHGAAVASRGKRLPRLPSFGNLPLFRRRSVSATNLAGGTTAR